MTQSIYWGDLHNHCAVSYGHGTPGRALANARQHLDFCAITGHAFWPDMPQDIVHYDNILCMHLAGFAKLQRFWGGLLKELAAANQPGTFATFPSYEWHSMRYGDHNAYACADEMPLLDADSPDALEQALRCAGCEAILLPHHIGYAKGHRGANWDCFHPRRTPVIEIFSNHGAGEADDAPYEYHHTMGPRLGESTLRAGLLAGHRFGFYAGTDSHDGYPGHYGHGRTGILADRLDRQSLWEALLARRTIASTGAKIQAEMQLDGAGIGQVLRRRESMPLSIRLEAAAAIDKLELIEGSIGASPQWRIHRLTAPPATSEFTPGRYKVRVETGWGRTGCISHWHVAARVCDGRLLGVTPCFRYSGYDNSAQEPTERILHQDEQKTEWTCRAASNPAGGIGGTHFNAGGTQSVLLELEAGESTRLEVEWDSGRLSESLPDLARRSVGQPIGGFLSPALKIHRAVPVSEFTCALDHSFRPARPGPGFIYLRLTQSDGQTAWLSPIWFE